MLSFDGIGAGLDVRTGAGGASEGSATGGTGGQIDNITGTADIALFKAGSGGPSTLGTGGLGGSIDAINLSAVGHFVRALKAGNGGDGAKAGGGGSVFKIKVTGDIGDFTSNFDVLDDTNGMGGIVAGEKGSGSGAATNGSITKVTAGRIAAMIAGTPASNAVDYANAVWKISGIIAGTIGADVNGDGKFDFIPGPNSINPGYDPSGDKHPADGDTAIDGMVLVRIGGVPPNAFSVNPLELLIVPTSLT